VTSTQRTAAVIGAGFGGLALAIRLQSAGIQTTLFEKRDKPGGRAYVYHDDGFTFDAGPTVITDPDCLEQLWALVRTRPLGLRHPAAGYPVLPAVLGGRLPLRLCERPGRDRSADRRKVARRMWEGTAASSRYSEDLYREGYEKLGTVPFLNFWSMIKAAPQLMRLESHRSVYSKGQPVHQGRPAPPGVQLPFAAGRGQSVQDLLDLWADTRTRAQGRCLVRQGRHRRLDCRHGQAL
jgi:phytoene desaturase